MPPFVPGIVPGTNPGTHPVKSDFHCVQERENPGSSQVFTGFVPGTNPVKSPGQTRVVPRPTGQKMYVYVSFSYISILSDGSDAMMAYLTNEPGADEPLTVSPDIAISVLISADSMAG